MEDTERQSARNGAIGHGGHLGYRAGSRRLGEASGPRS